MMKKVILLLSLLGCMMTTVAAVAQSTCRVQGRVMSVGNEPVSYATVGAYDGTKVVTRIVADEEGVFTLPLESGKKYTIEVTSVGLASHSQEVELPKAATYDMGVVTLKSSAELQEIVVETQKPIIKADAEKITYDVTADPESGGKSVIDMMRKVPMITVDADDNVTLNGASDFKVLIDGKESVMLKNNLKEILRAMPAAMVQDIQVITNPSTRYDAEGTGGIINIITRQAEAAGGDPEMSGVTGSITGYGDVLRGSFGGNAYLAVQHKKFTASINYSGGQFRSNQYSDAEQFNYNNPDMYRTIVSTSEFGDLAVKGNHHFLSFESSYELDKRNLFTLGLSGNLGEYGFEGKSLNQTYNQAGALVTNYVDLMTQDGTWKGASANFDYQHTFNRPMHTLTASYRYEYNPHGSAYSDSILVDDETLNAPLLGQMNENIGTSQEHTVQIDYNNPINEKHSVEAGAKYIARFNNSNDNQLMLMNNVWQSTGMMQDFDYTQQIAALYAGYGFTLEKWGFRAGGRYELTLNDASFSKGASHIDFGKPYGNFVPYFSANYNFSPMQSLRLSYTQRINRPGMHYLSPYEEWTTPISVRVGNPDLEAEVSHSMSLGYSLFLGKFNLNLQWTSRISTNAIADLIVLDPTTSITRQTYGNIATEQVHKLSIYMAGQVTPKFSYYVNLQPGYMVFDAPNLDRVSKRWGGSAFAGINWNAWKNGTITVNGGGMMPEGNLQSRSQSMMYFYGLGVSHSFLDDNLKVSLTANNIFNKYTKIKMESTGDGYSVNSLNGFRSQGLQVSVSYTFGNSNMRVKKANRSIVNDDVVGGSEEGQNTGGVQGM